MDMTTEPTVKFRSASMLRSSSGSSAVSSRITKADERRHGEHRQAGDHPRVEPVLRSPRSSTSWRPPNPTSMRTMPSRSARPAGFACGESNSRMLAMKKPSDADRQVDVEDPPPRPVVGDPAAHRGPERRGEHDAHAPHRHGHAPLAGGKDLPQHGLRDGNDRPAPQALEHARRDQDLHGGRDGRQEGADGEENGAEEEEAPPAEARGEPTRGGENDGIGGEVGGEHPRDLVEPGRERALDVGQRDIGDAGVEDLEHRHEHHGDGDGPAAGIPKHRLALERLDRHGRQ